MRLTFRAHDGVALSLDVINGSAGSKRLPVLCLPGMFSTPSFFSGRPEARVGLAHELDRPVYILQRRREGHWHQILDLDVPAAVEETIRHSCAEQCIIVGHSAGAGAAACMGLQDKGRQVAGVGLLSVSHPQERDLMRTLTLRTGVALIHLAGRFPARALGMGPVDEASGIFLPWIGWNLNGHWDQYLEAAPLKMPVFSATGWEDARLAPVAGMQQLHRLLDGGDPRSQSHVFPGGHASVVTGKSARKNLWPALSSFLKSLDN